MLFSSITFLFYFLPVFLICYFIVPKKFANAVLLLGSLFFYAWGEPRYLLLMVMMICAGYFFGIWIQKITTPGSRKLVTALSVAFCLVVLGFFKYYGFSSGKYKSSAGSFGVPFICYAADRHQFLYLSDYQLSVGCQS